MNVIQWIKNWWNDLLDREAPIYPDDYDAPVWGDEGTRPFHDTMISPEQVQRKIGRPRSNEARNADIANHLWRDESYGAVASKFGVSYNTVVKIARRYGIHRPKGRKKGSKNRISLDERNRNIAQAYKEGFTLRQVGDMYDLSYESIRQILAANGVKSRPRGSRSK